MTTPDPRKCFDCGAADVVEHVGPYDMDIWDGWVCTVQTTLSCCPDCGNEGVAFQSFYVLMRLIKDTIDGVCCGGACEPSTEYKRLTAQRVDGNWYVKRVLAPGEKPGRQSPGVNVIVDEVVETEPGEERNWVDEAVRAADEAEAETKAAVDKIKSDGRIKSDERRLKRRARAALLGEVELVTMEAVDRRLDEAEAAVDKIEAEDRGHEVKSMTTPKDPWARSPSFIKEVAEHLDRIVEEKAYEMAYVECAHCDRDFPRVDLGDGVLGHRLKDGATATCARTRP